MVSEIVSVRIVDLSLGTLLASCCFASISLCYLFLLALILINGGKSSDHCKQRTVSTAQKRFILTHMHLPAHLSSRPLS